MKKVLIVLCGFVGSLLLAGGLQASVLQDFIDKIKNNDPGKIGVQLYPTGHWSNAATKALCDALTNNTHVKSVIISQALDVKDPKVLIFDDDCLDDVNLEGGGNFTLEFYYLDEMGVQEWTDCLKQNTTINKLIIDDATFHEPNSRERFKFFKAVAGSKYLKLVGFNHCEIQIEDFIILLQSQSIQELSLRRNPELFSRMSCGLNPALHFGFYESFIKENFLNPLGNNLTQSLKILDLRGTEFDDECRKGVLMNANFRKNVYEPFRIILCSIGSLEKVIVSKVYCDDGDGKKAIIPFKSLIGFQNTNQNLNNQTITTNSSTSNGGSKNFSGTSKKSENI